MKTILRGIVSIVLLAYIVVGVVWARSQAAAATCTGLDIVVIDSLRSRFVTGTEVAREIGGPQNYVGQRKLSTINTDTIERTLIAIDKIEDVNCIITTGGRLRITVEPMQPVARVFEPTRSYYINKQGKTMSAVARYHCDVPVILGYFDATFTPESLLPLVQYINADSALSALVTCIKATSPTNIILVPAIHGHVINIGTPDNLDSKFARIERAYREILPVKGWNHYDTLSVKWRGQLVATRRAKTLPDPGTLVDDEWEQEAPDIGTMLVGDAAGVVAPQAIGRPKPTTTNP